MRTVLSSISALKWPLLAMALLLAYNAMYAPGFFHLEMKDGRLFGSLVDIFERATPVLLLALGMTLVIATGGIDLSVGSVMAISGAAAALLVSKGHAASIAFTAALGLALLCGSLNGFMVAAVGLQPIVATLILMVAGRGVAQLLTDGQMVPFSNSTFEYLGNGYLLGLPVSITIALGTILIASLLLRTTALGLFLETAGGNPVASRLAGVSVGVMRYLAYAVSGVCAGVAGLIVTSDIKAADPNNTGMILELDAILAVVLGGTALTGGRFTLAGSVLGALLMQALTTTILSRGVPVQYTQVVKALVILAVSLLQSPAMRAGLAQRFSRRQVQAP